MKTLSTVAFLLTLQFYGLSQSDINCDKDKTIIDRLLVSDSLVLWNPYTLQLSQTHYFLLKSDYRIFNVAFWKNDAEYQVHSCFTNSMKSLIENKYGEDIIDKTKEVADSLDRENSGLNPPKPPKELPTELMSMVTEIEFEGKSFSELSYFVFEFELDKNGNAMSIECKGYESKANQSIYYAAKRSSTKKIYKALNSLTWTPAYFKKQPVQFKVLLPINLTRKSSRE